MSSPKQGKMTSKNGGGDGGRSGNVYQEAKESLCDFKAIVGGDEHKKDWTKVKMPATTLQQAMASIPNIDPALHQGIAVWKITTGGDWKRRILTLNQDNLALFCTHKRVKSRGENVVAVVASTLPIPLWTPSKGFSLTSSTSYQDRYVRYIDVADLNGCDCGVIGSQNLETAKTGPSGITVRNRSEQILTIYHHGYRSLDVIIENAQHRKALVFALQAMQARYHDVQHWIGNDALLLRYIWYDVDVDRSGMISTKEFSKICNRINIELKDSKKEFSNFLKSKKITGRTELTYGECMALLQSIKAERITAGPADLWKTLFGDKTTSISADTLWNKFLKEAQGEIHTTVEDAESLLISLNTLDMDLTSSAGDDSVLHRAQFEEFLYSPFNNAYDPQTQQLMGKLDKPISHYWINTSHNTYLTGDQLQSRSSVEAYVRSLERGCKCLELDCWDGDEKTNAAIVFHGHTLTSKIGFRGICLVVKNYLETHPDSYPVILSLENHCSHPFQRTMAQDMKEVFASKLFMPTSAHTSDESLPSPEEMRGKVVIKGKRPPEADEGKEGNEKEDGEDEEDPYDTAVKPDSANAKPPKIVPELAKMTLFHGNKFKDFNKSIRQAPSHMHSIGETKITKIVNKSTDNPALWRLYNTEHMTRTYPAGARVDSSNYNPVLAWSMGCQLVALNFQTHDAPLYLNDGRFRQAGGCGYVLKPESLMGGKARSLKKVKISVLSGHCLPKPKGEKSGETIDPFIKVELHDVRTSSTSGKEEFYIDSHSTSSVNNNGYCPVWDDKGKDFEVENSDVAIILFTMVDEDIGVDDKIACSAIPVSCLRQGYRSIQLYDHHNTRTGPFQYATLLVKIEI